MERQLAGRHVLVTGAAGGIGAELCRTIAARGARVCGLDRDRAGLARLAGAQPDIGTVAADLGRPKELARRLAAHAKKHGGIDGLVSNAAMFKDAGTLAKTTPAGWKEEIDGNLAGAFNVVHALLPAMRRRRRGALVFVASVNARVFLGHPAYSAAKAALVAFARAAAVEGGRHGVRSNVLLPGTVATPAWRGRLRKDPRLFAKLRRWYPLGRIVEPAEVARAACFLLSDDASAVSGACLDVDCGLMAGVKPLAAELTQEEF